MSYKVEFWLFCRVGDFHQFLKKNSIDALEDLWRSRLFFQFWKPFKNLPSYFQIFFNSNTSWTTKSDKHLTTCVAKVKPKSALTVFGRNISVPPWHVFFPKVLIFPFATLFSFSPCPICFSYSLIPFLRSVSLFSHPSTVSSILSWSWRKSKSNHSFLSFRPRLSSLF